MADQPDDRPTAGWVELDLSALKPNAETDVPFRLVANRFTSSADDTERFIHDPLGELIAAQNADGSNIADLGLEPDWKVATFIVNHHWTLYPRHLYAMAAVKPDEKLVGVTMVKKIPTAAP